MANTRGHPPADVSLASDTDLLEAIDGYKRVRGVIEEIRDGQYL